MSDTEPVKVLYDQQCPACDFYCKRTTLEDGSLTKLDARDSSSLLDEVTRRDLDIDEGMVLQVGENIYYADEAIYELATRSSRTGLLNRLARLFFGNRRAAKVFYPVFKAMRNLLLKILRRDRINNLEIVGNDRF